MPDTRDRPFDADARGKFLEEVNRAYANLRRDPQAWAEELAQREVLESSLADGLKGEAQPEQRLD